MNESQSHGLSAKKQRIWTNSEKDERDRSALSKLFLSTGGQVTWRKKEKWRSDHPLGQWHGVTVSKEGTVTRLILGSNKLVGRIRHEIGELRELNWLSLRGNKIEGQIPDTIGSLLELRKINLSENELEGPIPDSIGNLENLVELNLSHNHFSGIPESMARLTNLTKLQLNMNRLTGNFTKIIAGLVSLTELSVCCNGLHGGIPERIDRLSKLTYLDMGHNRFSGEIPETIGALSALTKLNLESNKFSGCIPASIGELLKLKELALEENMLTGTIPASVGRLTELTRISYFLNQLQGPIPWPVIALLNGKSTFTLSRDAYTKERSELTIAAVDDLEAVRALIGPTLSLELRSLSVLTLRWLLPVADYASWTGPFPESICALTWLTELNLSYNKLSGDFPASLVNLRNLNALMLGTRDYTMVGGNNLTGGFEHICQLTSLTFLSVPGFWEAFDDVPPGDCQSKLGWLRERFAAAEEPLL